MGDRRLISDHFASRSGLANGRCYRGRCTPTRRGRHTPDEGVLSAPSDENVTSNLIRDFLHQVRVQLDGRLPVLWGRASVHAANRIEQFFERYDRTDEIRIPTACPELTPCEGVWDWSKLTDTGNVTPQRFEEVISRTRSSLRKLQHREHVHR